ncbi:MAG TPA: HIT domain-containing protein [Bacteroidota bacterium]|nr:HIT domain-containing protein [Bacteroidota bacterium]
MVMKRMWSPWRAQYIQSFSARPKRRTKESLFRAAYRSRDDEKNLVVWRGRHCFLIMNRYPYNSGHVMIVPNRQVADVQDLTAAELAEIMQTLRRTIKALDALMHPQGYNFGANFGRTAGAGIDDHVHFHIVPRWNGDTNFMPVLADTKVISEDMNVTWDKLRKLL